MRHTAFSAKTGKILMTNAGSLDEASFKQTVASAFPYIPPGDIVTICDEEVKGALAAHDKAAPRRSVVWRGSFCFPPDAKILTTKGMKEIKDIVPGDMVFTHLGRPRKVLRTSVRHWRGGMLAILTAIDKEELKVSPGHNLIGTKGRPCVLREGQTCNEMTDIKAGDLTPQDFLLDNGSLVQVTSIRKFPYDGPVFDLEVEEDHSYTVNGKSIHNSDLGGYANMNREITLRLVQRGFAVKLEMLQTGMQVDGTTFALLKALESNKLADERSCPLVVGFTPMPVNGRGRRVIFYTMMESQRLHKQFVDRCNQFASEVWVPCSFYEEAFKASGVVRPVRVMPLGVNHQAYVPGAPVPDLPYEELPSGRKVGLPKGKFKFMSLFGWSYRKGADILCRSFLRQFSSRDDACLVIYSRYMGSSHEQHKDFIRKEILSYYEQEKKDEPAAIYYCGECIPIGDLPGCYSGSDAFVFCSRGEGFGLPLIEAGACGLPVISSYNTAMTEYLDDDVAYLVRHKTTAPANDKLTWISEFYRDQEFAVLGEEEIEEFGRLMRRVLQERDEARAKASRFRDRILEKYTWDACAERVACRLSEI